jgi:type II secretory pathway component GspD/PulD (secretin)
MNRTREGFFLFVASLGLFTGVWGQTPASQLADDVIQLAKQPVPSASASTGVGGDLDEARELARLEALPAIQIPIEDASLASAIKLVAQSAGMNYIAPTTEDFAEPVSMSATINSWRLLQLMADRYRFTVRYHDGMWFFSRESAGALIAKTYEFTHANLDVVTSEKTQQNSSMSSADTGTNRSQGQGFDLVYKVDSKKVVDDVRELIGLPPLASQTAVAMDGKLPDEHGIQKLASNVKGEEKSQKVIYLPKTNALYVVCYRSQHELVAEYVRQADQPPIQIRIEARFFATSSDPESILGIDYSEAQPRLTLSDSVQGGDIALHRPSANRWPPQAILSSSALSVQLNALEKDERSEKIENPFVVTTSNHEALFSVGQEEPFLDSSTLSPGAVDGGLGSTTNRISVKRIGTAVNVVPTYFKGGPGEKPKIRLIVKMELGRLSGFRQVTPQVVYPIVDSQKYEFTTTIEEGQALAFGGLTGVASTNNETRLPLLGKIPVLGGLFRHTDKRGQQRNLIGYIIPSVVRESLPSAPAAQLSGAAASL